jgi:DNA-binding CsgD family transcriptional regulator/tetratricopeptide (TPR) repeat protein
MFVGREAERRLLVELVERIREGTGGAVWLAGNPGIGKSALIAAALDGVDRDGCRVYCGAASEQSPIFPLQVLLEVLGAGVPFGTPDATEPDSVQESRAEIASLLYGGHAEAHTPLGVITVAAERLVALVHRLCAISPVILVVDDTQWADQASLEVLTRLTRTLSQLPLLLVTAVRPVPARAEVSALRQALADAGGLTIELRPVSEAETAEITRQLLGSPPSPALAEQLTAAGGNPLYLRELIDALVRESRLRLGSEAVDLMGDPVDLPTTLPAAIELRLGFLSEAALSALRVAAVLGPAFSVTDLGTVTGQRATELADAMVEAVKAGVLTDAAPGALAFRHQLIHHTLYQRMPASLRAALHRQAAEQLARVGARPEQVAVQLLAAPWEASAWAVDWVTGAAPLLSQRAPQVSADLLARAREGLAGPDPRRAQLAAELAFAQLMLGDNEQAVRVGRPVLSETADPALAGRVAWTVAYALTRLDRMAEAVEVADAALTRDGLPPVWLARLRARRAMSLYAAGRNDEARADAERAEAEGSQAGDRLAMGYALYTLGLLEFYQRRNAIAGKEALERALAMFADDPEATDLVLMLMANLGGGLSALGLPDEADRMFAAIAAMADRGTEPRQGYVRVLSAVYSFYRGRWDDALTEVETAERLPLDTSFRRSLAGVVAQVAVHRDDRATAATSLRDAPEVELSNSGVGIMVEFLLDAWALSAERDARPADALARLLATFDPGGTGEFGQLGVISSQWLPDVVRLALATGQPGTAAAAARACAREAETQARPMPQAAAQHCQGLLDADPDAVLAAAGRLQAIGYPVFGAQALENAAVLHAERGDNAAARTAYLQAVDVYSEVGAAWDIMRADTRLRQYNIRRAARGVRHRSATGWDALTPTEQKIARLIAKGLSNPDIAGQMFLSRNTVQTHVSHILTKFNARSRVEIARAVPPE